MTCEATLLLFCRGSTVSPMQLLTLLNQIKNFVVTRASTSVCVRLYRLHTFMNGDTPTWMIFFQTKSQSTHTWWWASSHSGAALSYSKFFKSLFTCFPLWTHVVIHSMWCLQVAFQSIYHLVETCRDMLLYWPLPITNPALGPFWLYAHIEILRKTTSHKRRFLELNPVCKIPAIWEAGNHDVFLKSKAQILAALLEEFIVMAFLCS